MDEGVAIAHARAPADKSLSCAFAYLVFVLFICLEQILLKWVWQVCKMEAWKW